MAKKKKSFMTAAEFRKTYTRKEKKTVKKTEELEQSNVCAWIKDKYPHLLYTIDLAGMNLTPAQRKVHETRCKAGHPDIMIQEWFQNLYCGLAIEFKKYDVEINDYVISKSEHLKRQAAYLNDLRERCWIAVFVSGEENCKAVIDLYLKGTLNSLGLMNAYVWPKIKINENLNY